MNHRPARRWIRPLSSLCALLVTALALHETGCLASTRTAPPRAAQRDLRVMTFNVNFGLRGDDATLDAMGQPQADIVLVQESNESWESAIRQRFHSTFPYMQFGHPDRMPAGGLAVLSRYPFDVREQSPSDGGFFFAWRLVVYSPRGPVQMLNVHLRPQVTDDGSFVRGHFSTGHLRRRELTAHLRNMDPTLPTIIAGDFNESEGGEAVTLLTDRQMRSALREFAPRDTTWRWPVGPFVARQRFDHILYDPRVFECVHARVSHEGRSDHEPVIADLRWLR
jgi:endonuclease/exonuclease/phosphatase (EEP) superfamily protein YafD